MHLANKLKKLFWALAIILFSGTANAATFDVHASANSSSGGTGVSTGINYTVGEFIIGSVDPNDLWSAGLLPRWSNADGLTGDLFATGSDESGETAGTLIGQLFLTGHKMVYPLLMVLS